jgi:branched-chain amino acid transport system permease protein
MTRRAAVALWVVALVVTPLVVSSDFWLSVLIFAGIAAIGAMGLNLLTGYTGQLSLAQPLFLGAGAYTTSYLTATYHQPFPLWLLGGMVSGVVLGALAGFLCLRFHGHYLVIVSIGLVFLGEHVFVNWSAITGGLNGISVSAPIALGPLDLGHLSPFSRNQGYFWLIWALVGVGLLAVANIVGSRPGRAMQAVRDREIAAAIVGIDPTAYKIGAFIVCSAYAATAGALYASYARFVDPNQWSLLLGVQYLAMIVIGGAGTLAGPIVGALFLGAVPLLADKFAGSLHGAGGGSIAFALSEALFGIVLIGFLLFEPRGLVAVIGPLVRRPQPTPRIKSEPSIETKG